MIMSHEHDERILVDFRGGRLIWNPLVVWAQSLVNPFEQASWILIGVFRANALQVDHLLKHLWEDTWDIWEADWSGEMMVHLWLTHTDGGCKTIYIDTQEVLLRGCYY